MLDELVNGIYRSYLENGSRSPKKLIFAHQHLLNELTVPNDVLIYSLKENGKRMSHEWVSFSKSILLGFFGKE